MNAPPAVLWRFGTATAFLAHARGSGRRLVATAIGPGAVGAYSAAAREALVGDGGGIYLLLGAETRDSPRRCWGVATPCCGCRR